MTAGEIAICIICKKNVLDPLAIVSPVTSIGFPDVPSPTWTGRICMNCVDNLVTQNVLRKDI